ncbi:MAG: PepSY domain-containing protein [Acidobacteriota bacterium]
MTLRETSPSAPRRSTAWGTLAFVHRWLGIAGCLLFLLWFASGIAMMYVRMPELTATERLAHTQPLDESRVSVSPAEAAHLARASPETPVQVTTLGTRPVYRFGGASPATVFADQPATLSAVSADEAMTLAREFAADRTGRLRYVGLLSRSDQWTLQSRADLPLHHVALDDDAGEELYVSSRTGEIVMQTTRRERVWAYAGPVAHWLYLPILRRNGPLWTRVIIWASAAGCVLCLSGLVAGLLRFSPRRLFATRGRPARPPYAGWLRWHHYAGLIFGLVTLSWTFSGLLSMGPFPSLSSGGLTAVERRAVSGDAPAFETVSLDALRAALRSARTRLTPKELTLAPFLGQAYWIASESPTRHVLVSAARPEEGPFQRFENGVVEALARDAATGATIVDMTWLGQYDSYYYDRSRARPLPVLRVRYGDAAATWLYLDPSRGAIALVVRDRDRLNRWLYHGLHSLDFPGLYGRRPAWDLLVIALSLGGMASAVTSVVPAWRRLRRLARPQAAGGRIEGPTQGGRRDG